MLQRRLIAVTATLARLQVVLGWAQPTFFYLGQTIRGFVSPPRIQPHALDIRVPTTSILFQTRSYSVSVDEEEEEGFILGAESGDEASPWEEENATNEEDGKGENDGDNTDSDDGSSPDPFLQDFHRWLKAVTKTREALQKKSKSLSNELKKAESLEETTRRAQLLTSNMYLFTPGLRTATVNDWENDGAEVELTLDDDYHTASEEADALFQQARKVKRGSKVVNDLLQQTAEGLNTLDELTSDLEACLSPDGDSVEENMFLLAQDRLIRSSRQTGFSQPRDEATDQSTNKQRQSQQNSGRKKPPALGTPASNVRKLTSPGGCVVLVGRNRRGNEHLTFNVARGDDIWMHSRGCPGAHVLIQQRRGSPQVTDACVQFAADLAIFYSDARTERSFLVTSAEPKHLQKPRGAPLGAVKLREEAKTYTGYPNEVADDLKQAREESGQENSYRFTDKGKHRRKTKESAKSQQDKQRARVKEKRSRKTSS